MRTETADKPKLKKMFKTEQTEIKTPNPEISEFQNFKMGKRAGGYMLNYHQYHNNPLDYHFTNHTKKQPSTSPN